MQGGFIGVDIFFVISGYLISWIILQDLDKGTFSFWNFYSRRIRRIFPALIVVLISVLAFGWFTLFEDEYKALGKHVFGGSSFIANILFWRETGGYFDVAARAKPLLHLWSLGIEEQFYILFPLLLYSCYKRYFRIVVAVLFLCLLSFLDNLYLRNIDRIADFYSPLPRFWELFSGAVLCSVMRLSSTRERFLKADAYLARILYVKPQENDGHCLSLTLGVLGTVIYGIALLIIRRSHPFPGWEALLPILGTILFIAAGPLNPISKYLLCNRFSVFIGLVSYPFYLWHWVFISFAFIILGGLEGPGTRLLRVGLIASAFILSVLTFYLVERPIRFKQAGRKAKMTCLVGLMIVLGLSGLYIKLDDGLPERTGIKLYKLATEQTKWPDLVDDAGLAYTGIEKGKLTYCRYTDSGSKTTVAVIGDSHSESSYWGIAELGKELSYNTVLLGWIVPAGEIWSPNASKNIEVVFKILESKTDITKVFLSTRGIIHITGIHNYTGNLQPNAADDTLKRRIDIDVYKKSLQDYIDRLNNMGKQTYIIAENPELPADPRDYVARPLRPTKNKGKFPDTFKSEVLARQEPYLKLLDEIRGATIIQTIPTFCPTEKCLSFNADGIPLYYDDDHLSIVGSLFQAEHILMPYLRGDTKK